MVDAVVQLFAESKKLNLNEPNHVLIEWAVEWIETGRPKSLDEKRKTKNKETKAAEQQQQEENKKQNVGSKKEKGEESMNPAWVSVRCGW